MTVVISTSSPMASVALFDSKNALLGMKREEAPMAASGACLRMLATLLPGELREIDLFVADVGPGSFTGVKVAVTLAKTLAFAAGKKVGGIPSFDLVSATETVAVPSGKGEWLVREVGLEPVRSSNLTPTTIGYGGALSSHYPDAAHAGQLLSKVKLIDPEFLIPAYYGEPSISTPKRPYASLASGAGAA